MAILPIFLSFNLIAQPEQIEIYENMEWCNIGPNRERRSLGCAGSPGRTNEYYFGATGGGHWKTIDGGEEVALPYQQRKLG